MRTLERVEIDVAAWSNKGAGLERAREAGVVAVLAVGGAVGPAVHDAAAKLARDIACICQRLQCSAVGKRRRAVKAALRSGGRSENK